jgi:hypothetical protein
MGVGFHGISLSGRILPAGHKKKGAQSSGPFLGSQALKPSRPYPQKLWITLWVGPLARSKSAAKNAKPLP